MTTVYEVYRQLFESLGPQNWWPGDSPLEIMVGAVLVQNTNWRNVEQAIDNLREAGLLDPHRLHAVEQEELAELIRPAGYYRLKAGRLANLVAFVVQQYNGSLAAMAEVDRNALREELLEIRGIGPETADAILLYALGRPSFVVDTYTHRIFARHGWVEYEADYHQLQDYFHSSLEENPALFNEYHALLVEVGKKYCRRTNPKCGECPLECLLPESGIVEPF